jgi:hypothetical protein
MSSFLRSKKIDHLLRLSRAKITHRQPALDFLVIRLDLEGTFETRCGFLELPGAIINPPQPGLGLRRSGIHADDFLVALDCIFELLGSLQGLSAVQSVPEVKTVNERGGEKQK